MNAIDKEIAEFAKAFFLLAFHDGLAPAVRYDKISHTIKVCADDYRGGATVEFITDKSVGAYKAAERVYKLVIKDKKVS